MKNNFAFSFISDDNGDRYIANKSKDLVAQLHRRENQDKIFIWFYKYDETEENEAILADICIEKGEQRVRISNKESEDKILSFLKEIITEFNIEVTSTVK